MNVARAVLDRLIKDKVDKTNDRGCIRLCFNRGGAVSLAQLQKLASFTELFEDLLHVRGIGAVILPDQIFDLLRWRNDHVNVFTEREAKILCRVLIERINQRDTQRITAHFNRKRAVQPCQSAGNETQHFGRDFVLDKIDKVEAEPISNCLIKAEFIDEAAIDHRLFNRFSIQLSLTQNIFHLRRLQDLLFNEELRYLFVVHISGSWNG